jgi:predicted RNA-binding Zn ribbon-like protein
MSAKTPLWEWLGDPLPIDVANTVRRSGSEYEELWSDGASVSSWAAHETGRLPPISAPEADRRLGELRRVRDDVFAILRAAARGEPYPGAAVDRLNARAREYPVADQLGERPGALRHHVVNATDRVGTALALIVHATVGFTAHPDLARLALCDAPSCGQFFLRDRRNQRWCGTACGTRARVARHAAHATRAGGHRPRSD